MSTVQMRVSRELLESLLRLGKDRRITDVQLDFDQVFLTIDAPDAPEGTTRMVPSYGREEDGSITMLTPGWLK